MIFYHAPQTHQSLQFLIISICFPRQIYLSKLYCPILPYIYSFSSNITSISITSLANAHHFHLSLLVFSVWNITLSPPTNVLVIHSTNSNNNIFLNSQNPCGLGKPHQTGHLLKILQVSALPIITGQISWHYGGIGEILPIILSLLLVPTSLRNGPKKPCRNQIQYLFHHCHIWTGENGMAFSTSKPEFFFNNLRVDHKAEIYGERWK